MMKHLLLLIFTWTTVTACIAQETVTITCDSVYAGKGYRIVLHRFSGDETDETRPNTVFTFSKVTGGREVVLLRDSVFSITRTISFRDFNNDGIKDVLLQHYFDVRSNESNYLYLVDTHKDRLKKIKGFEQIKNPEYLPADNLVSNYVVSGTNWSGFYQVQGDHVRDFGMTIDAEDDQARVRTLRQIRKRKDWVAPVRKHRKHTKR